MNPEQLYRIFVETTNEWIWSIDLNLVHTYSNQAVSRILGYQVDDIVGQRSTALIHEGDLPGLKSSLAACIEEKKGWSGWVIRWRHKDGGYRYLESNAVPLLDDRGGLIGFSGSDRDITLQIEAQEALEKERAQLKQYLDVAGVMLLSLDVDGNVQMINIKGCEILGYEQQEVIGRNWFELAIPEKEQKTIRKLFLEILSGQADTYEYFENDIQNKHGDLITIGWRNVLLKDKAGNVIGTISSGEDITSQQKAVREAERSKVEWSYAMDFFEDPIYLLDLNRRVIRANQAFYAMTGLTRQQVIGQHIVDIIHPQGEEVPCPVCKAQEEKYDAEIMLEADHPDNPANVPIEVICRMIRDEGGEPVSMLMTIKDLSRLRETQEKLGQSQAVFENTIEGIMITDTDLGIVAVNPAFTSITGYSKEEVLGKTPRLLKSDRHERAFYQAMWEQIIKTGGWKGEIWNRTREGEVYPEWLSISVVRNDEGEITNYVGVFSDISQLKQSQSRLEYLAHHDPLTDLPNRLLFKARVGHAMEQADRDGTKFAILFLDLDRFKNINDSLGHTIGDAILTAAGTRLSRLLRREDTVARLGGDEFTILTEGLKDIEAIEALAEKIHESFTKPFLIEGHELYVEASVGISLYPTNGKTVEVLLQNADAAMYRAKEAGRNTYHFYTDELTEHAYQKLTISGELRKAMENNQLLLHYQPQLNMQSGCIIGLEALVRWQHPEKGMIPPVKFIPLAEETSLIVQLGEWVLKEACSKAKQWLDDGKEFGRIAVNVSGRQFQQVRLVDQVRKVLKETGLPASYLELEITESFVMGKDKPLIQSLYELRELGVSLAIDDFGTGYSSLSYLKQLPVNRLKIDRGFVMDIPRDENDVAITRAVIALAKSMNFEVVAEGVETAEQQAFLLNEHCHLAQGYLFSKPLPETELLRHLSEGQRQSNK